MACRVFLGRKIIGIHDSYYEVYLLRKGVTPEIDRAYIIGDYVYIYAGEIKDYSQVKEGYMYILDKTVTVGEVHSKEAMEQQSIDKIVDINIYSVFNDISRDREYYTDAETIEAINNNSEVFAPTINTKDDFLKKLIKTAIINKRINLKNYKDKFASQNDLNNMKSGLTHETKMSVPYFLKWLEVLGLECAIVIRDNGTDKLAPLKESIEIIEGGTDGSVNS